MNIDELLQRMPEGRYHADPCETPSLSSSIARVLNDQSPAHAYLRHPRLGGAPSVHSKQFDFGKSGHTLLLKRGQPLAPVWIQNVSKGKPEHWCVPDNPDEPDPATILGFKPAENWRTAIAREAQAKLRAEGRIPVLEADRKEMMTAVTSWREKLAKHRDEFGKPDPIRLDGVCERVAIWHSRTEKGPVLCRAMFDHVKFDGFEYDGEFRPSGATIDELKCTTDARPGTCVRRIIQKGYHIQRAAYVDAISTLFGLHQRVKHRWIFAEIVPPYAVTVMVADGGMRTLGEFMWERAASRWHDCITNGEWPDYSGRTHTAEAPPWALREMDEYDADRWGSA